MTNLVPDELLYQVALSKIEGVGPINCRSIVAYLGSAKEALTTSKPKLEKVPGIGSILSYKLVDQRKKVIEQAEKTLETCLNQGIDIIPIQSNFYPYRLREIPDAPLVIYNRGSTHAQAAKAVAIVGTRNITSYGKSVCESIVSKLAASGVVIISGLAYGVDTVVHRNCLSNDIATIGVMANGLDRVYPGQNRDLALKMLEKGGVLSEHEPGVKPEAPHFPRRNRIIAGMADATIVIEASEKGGALITCRMALEYNREVFAVPGPINAEYSYGCNQIIAKSGAQLFLNVDSFLEEMGWGTSQPGAGGKAKKTFAIPDDLNEVESTIVNLLVKEDMMVDEISYKGNIPVSALAVHLLNLELRGIIKNIPGKKFSVSA